MSRSTISPKFHLIASSGAFGIGAAAARAEPLRSVGKPEGFVDIVAWPGYIERDKTDPAYDWATGFEHQSGC
jgi:putative spermidine/putrescine transport system substrate-binding protein